MTDRGRSHARPVVDLPRGPNAPPIPGPRRDPRPRRPRDPRPRSVARPHHLAIPAAAALAVALIAVAAWIGTGSDVPIDASRSIDGGSLVPRARLAVPGRGGTVGGTERAPAIDWREGTLSVSVTPDRGVGLTVTTDEALVEVVGTVFDVHRAHRATRVAVTEGTVRVTCAGESQIEVHGGESHDCLPADPSALLLRVVELTRAGADPADRLSTLDRAMTRTDTRVREPRGADRLPRQGPR